MTEILIENEQSKEKVTDEIIETIKKVCKYTLEFEKCEFEAEISVTFVDNEEIRLLNKEHRGIDRATDVLSFPMLELDENGNIDVSELEYEDTLMLGDIVISLERAREQSIEFGHSFIREIAFLTAHSMLHLLGYDHVNSDEEENVMRTKQTKILEDIGITRE